jgi:hypothetical protein
VAVPITQSIRLRWRPLLQFYERRIAILRSLEDRGLLVAFGVGDRSIDAELPDWRRLSVTESGLTLEMLAATDDPDAIWGIIGLVVEGIAPTVYARVRISYQHLVDLPMTFEEAVESSYRSLYGPLGTKEVAVDDWAFLATISVQGPPQSTGTVEFGIVRDHEIPNRLNRVFGRQPGMERLGRRQWTADEFKPVCLFADSDLVCDAVEGREESFLQDARLCWSSSHEHMDSLVRAWSDKLIESKEVP